MDRETIDKILYSQATINSACLLNGLSQLDMPTIKVPSYSDVEAIADMIYGVDGWKKMAVDNAGGWTRAWVKSPEGVEFFYSNFDKSKAVLHEVSTVFKDGQMITTERDKAVV